MRLIGARKHGVRRALELCAFALGVVNVGCAGNNGESVKTPGDGGSGSVAGTTGASGAVSQSGGSSAGVGPTGGGAGGSSSQGMAGTQATGGGSGASGSGGSGGMGMPGGVAPVVAAGVRWVGRVDVSDAQAIKLAWSGTGFIGSFSGATVSAKLKTVGGADDIFFQPVVDGKPGMRFSVGSTETTVELAAGLGAGEHRIELYRETEGKGFGYSVFSGFVSGTPGAIPPASGRLIELIGDSITAGFGNLGAETHEGGGTEPPGGCPFTTETESAYLAYGHVAARAVDADASVLAGSGWGIYSDNLGEPKNVMPALFGNTLGEQAVPPWSFAAKPQAVIINLGTNDAFAKTLTAENFKPAYTAFIATIRSKYPDALIFCALGSMLSGTDRSSAEQFLKEIVAEHEGNGDDKVQLLDLGTQDASAGTGCAWHPNVAENARMGALLASALETNLGW